jgi:hypothetical protein
MSTAPIDRGLYAVPAPPQQERFALLLRLKRTARRALDTVLALPRGAGGWVLRQARTALSMLGSNPVLARLGARLSSLGELIRSVGPIPAAAAVLSIPAVWRGTLRTARFIGSKVAAGASALWQQTRSLLGKLGPTGARIASGPDNAGTVMRRFLVGVAVHPVTQTIIRGVTSLAGLVRPLSQSVVVHRLLGMLVGASWLRWVIELVALPLVIAPRLVVDLSAGPRPASRLATSAAHTARHPAPASEAPVDNLTGDGQESENLVVPGVSDDWAAVLEPRNRAERRAQQQTQTHAKRARARH